MRAQKENIPSSNSTMQGQKELKFEEASPLAFTGYISKYFGKYF